MLARHAGQVVFVSGAIPGERVVAPVERRAPQVLFATVVDVLRPSPHRRPVSFDPACGGSVLAHIEYPHQLDLKREIVGDALARIGRIRLGSTIAIESSPENGYRSRARFHVERERIGFFKEGSHALCEPGPTGQLLPATVDAIARFTARLGQPGWTGAASVELAENVPASERVLHIELHAGERDERWDAVTATAFPASR
jgi:23S rRNA (uracil1939-C5)-methyltransferase